MPVAVKIVTPPLALLMVNVKVRFELGGELLRSVTEITALVAPAVMVVLPEAAM